MASEYEMDNSGQKPIRVPGLGGLSLYYEVGKEDRFEDSLSGWEQKPAITAPEMAMLQLMSDLTDRDDWSIHIFNDEIVRKWREETFRTQDEARTRDEITRTEEEARFWEETFETQEETSSREELKMRVMSERAWDWCILELRDKALMFEKDRFIRLFDAGSAVCKSDVLVSESIRLKLKYGFAPMLKQPFLDPHQALVDPSLFPLVYGKTSVLIEGQVSIRGAIESFGSGKRSFKQSDERKDTSAVERRIKAQYGSVFSSYKPHDLRRFYWSSNFQLLPCEVEFEESGTNVHITSYINNLHPHWYKSVYSNIEELISSAIKPWNECLVKGAKPRWPIRIRTYGLTWEPEYPQSIVDGLYQDCSTDAYKTAAKEAEQFFDLPNRSYGLYQDCTEDMYKTAMEEAKQLFKLPNHSSNQLGDLLKKSDEEVLSRKRINIGIKWENLYELISPEPGMSFTYNDWKDGRNGAAIKEKRRHPESSVPIQPDPNHQFYSIKLEDTFRSQGLQVIIKVGSIKLSHTDNWHMDTLNEHIVATAIYFYDIKNITEIKISFRQRAYMAEKDYQYNRSSWPAPPDDFEPLGESIEALLGFKDRSNQGALCTQELGSISAPQGRLITWPNTLQHCVRPVALVDAKIPGHGRFVMLSLVDPHYRVCSTRNVPPQRHDWWAESVHSILALRGIPLEIAEKITEMTDSWPVGMNEAKQDQEQLIREQKWAETAFVTSMPTAHFGEPY